MKLAFLLLILGIFLIGVYSQESYRRESLRGISRYDRNKQNQYKTRAPPPRRTPSPPRKHQSPIRKSPPPPPPPPRRPYPTQKSQNTPKYFPEPTRKPTRRPYRPASPPKNYKKSSIPGVPGRDYPTFNIPSKDFECRGKAPGYYADVNTRCQTYHICLNTGGKRSFLCVNGTVFNQRSFTCDWWNKVNCQESPKFFHRNTEIGKEENSRRRFPINPRISNPY
ncbi:sulfated surface glycoprotein 185-like [Centruroides sculpturatus]|uniref:sulfated surface glycoprotein 185-like n=1 Tax=Centruroides sculpturatus TaxID=218467 RepID=UPI000C6EF92D|nr:sulfated surface glycoprotein 185-like [Centruroides sculpturatus]